MQSNAGGLRWRTLDDKTIEIEGQGVVQAPDTGYFADAKFIDSVYDQWGDRIEAWSDANGVDGPWTGALMIIESRGKNYPANSAGAGGLMALLQSTMDNMLGRHGNLNDPDDSIDAGTRYLAQLKARYAGQLPAMAAGYNAGSAIPSGSTQCRSTIDGKWQKDGTSAQNSMGFVEDCSKAHSSQYSLRAVALNNTIRARGLGGSASPPSSGGMSFGKVLLTGALAGVALGAGVTLAEDAGWIRRLFRG